MIWSKSGYDCAFEEDARERNGQLVAIVSAIDRNCAYLGASFGGKHLDTIGILTHEHSKVALKNENIVESADFLDKLGFGRLVHNLRQSADAGLKFRLFARDVGGTIVGVEKILGYVKAEDMTAESSRNRDSRAFDAAHDLDQVRAVGFLADVLVNRFDDVDEVVERFYEVPCRFGIAVFAD